jgi:adenylosuccinate lyase
MIRGLRAQVYTGFHRMKVSPLTAISPADGRYSEKVSALRSVFSEFGLIRYRVLVEVRWLQMLAREATIGELGPLPDDVDAALDAIAENFSPADAERVKSIERRTNHDVKAVEYYIGERLEDGAGRSRLRDFLHFACTSEDINNLAYALMLDEARRDSLLPAMRDLRRELEGLAREHAEVAMLSRTHGQTASPTTVGKEFANVCHRLARAEQSLESVRILGKFNGAVGNYNAHLAAYPDVDWPALSKRFVESLGLEQNTHTTQIEPHDWTAEYCHALVRYDTILTDLCRDLWGYISLGYFRQKVEADEVGSSTMPHKVNPIDFENAEGNLGLANALLSHFAQKLPISRWQRDLTDSTVQRNFGVAIAYVQIALASARKGVGKLELDTERVAADVDAAWEVLAEAIQTVMRRYGIPEPYEKLKALTRGQSVTRELLRDFVRTLDLPEAERDRLLALHPAAYTGAAADLARDL